MVSRGMACLCTAPLSVPKNPAAKSPVSITYKLIEGKGLQVYCFGHLRKTGGGGVTDENFACRGNKRLIGDPGRENTEGEASGVYHMVIPPPPYFS